MFVTPLFAFNVIMGEKKGCNVLNRKDDEIIDFFVTFYSTIYI